MRGAVFASAGALLLLAAIPAAGRLEAVLGRASDEVELALFPTGAWVRPLAFGWTELAADLVWLQALQYYGKHRASDRRYPYLQTLFETLTDLDPRFVNAYIFGALTLAEDQHQPEAALRLLEKGMRENPKSWWLAFEYGFSHYVHGSDPARAGHWLARASRMEGAPDWVGRLAAYASTQAGDVRTARALWLGIYQNTENAEIRRIAADYLASLEPSIDPDQDAGGSSAPTDAPGLDPATARERTGTPGR